MSPDAIRAAVAASPELLAQIQAQDWDGAAATLSAGATRLRSAEITPRGSAALFPSIGDLPGPLAFQLAMRQLAAFASAAKASQTLGTSLLGEAIEEQLAGFRTQGLDFSVPALRSMLDMIGANGGLSAEQVAGFKSLAETPDTVTEFEVRQALFNDDGTLRI